MKRKLFTGGIAVMLCLAMSGNAQQKATSHRKRKYGGENSFEF